MPFNNGEAAMFSAPTWARWSIDLPECNKGVDPDDTSDEANALRAEQQACNEEKTGVFPLPGLQEGDAGDGVRRRLQHRHPREVASTRSSPRNLVRIIFSEEYQTMLAENGLIPGQQPVRRRDG